MRWPWQNRPNRDDRIATAEAALKASDDERAVTSELAADLRQLQSENHITERIHRAMRGGGRQ